MKKALPALTLLPLLALAVYTPPTPTLSHALTPAEVAELVERAPDTATITATKAMLLWTGVETNALNAAIVEALRAAIADTRTNIAEVAALTDAEVAGLYLRQMRRDVTPLIGNVPTNTVEYLIGAGMRLDIRSAPPAPSSP